MGKIKILNPGLFSTIQDLGRTGYMELGISRSGVMDRFSYLVSNYLVGNSMPQASVEITMMGPEILFEENELISVCGGNLSPSINGNEIPLWTAVQAVKGDRLSFGRVRDGARAYLSFLGGIKINSVLGSFSTNIKAGFGGFKGRKLNANDEVEVNSNAYDIEKYSGNKLNSEYIPKYTGDAEIRVVLGPQEDYFSQDEINKFFKETYEVSPACDRMGYRLKGEKLISSCGSNIISDGINTGSIQIPGDGYPIILMNDCGTTGGYPKIGCVINSDLDIIAQLKTGDKIKFTKTTIEEAHKQYKSHIEKLKILKEKLLNKTPEIHYYTVKIDDSIYSVSIKEI